MLNLRNSAALAVAALSLAVAPAASAQPVTDIPGDVYVCNTASQQWRGGDLTVSDTDLQGFIHYETELRTKKVTDGLKNAATHSRALAICVGEIADGSGGGSGDGSGDGDGSGGVGGGDDTIGGGTA